MGCVSSNGCELTEDAPLPLLPDDVDVSSIIPRGTRIFVASTCGSGSVDDDAFDDAFDGAFLSGIYSRVVV